MQPDWEIWIDTNISPVIAKWMMEYTGYTVRSSYVLELNAKSDLDIFNLAREKGLLSTKDPFQMIEVILSKTRES